MIRNPQHRDDVVEAGAQAVVADVEAMDTDALTDLLRVTTCVVWSARCRWGNPQRTYAVDRDAAIRSMDAAAAAGVARYLMVSYFGAGLDHGLPADHSFYPCTPRRRPRLTHICVTATWPGRSSRPAV